MNDKAVKAVLQVKNSAFIRKLIKPYMDNKRKKDMQRYEHSEESARIKELKNKFEGKDCYIIGNGPSLKIKDLEMLRGKYTFAANRIYTLFDKTNWRPTFYTCVDPEAYKLFGPELMNMEAEYVFLDVTAKKYVGNEKKENLYYIYQYSEFTLNRWDSTNPFINEDVSKFVSLGMTVTFVAMQLAIYMGFKRIYLLGVDHNYAKQVSRAGVVTEDKSKATYGEGIIDTGIGIQYTDTTTEAYEKAQQYCQTHDVKIYNATRGGKLEIFPRVSLEDSFL